MKESRFNLIAGLGVGFLAGMLFVFLVYAEELNSEKFRQFKLKHPAAQITYEEFKIIQHL